MSVWIDESGSTGAQLDIAGQIAVEWLPTSNSFSCYGCQSHGNEANAHDSRFTDKNQENLQAL